MFKHIKKMIAINIAVIFFISLDRLLKVFAFKNAFKEFNLFGEILKFNYENNYNIAFSLPLSGDILIVVIFIILIILIFFTLRFIKMQEYNKGTGLFLIILGASSNLYDRIKYGFVIDYLDLKYFTVFNLADIMIVVGIIFFLLISINEKSYVK